MKRMIFVAIGGLIIIGALFYIASQAVTVAKPVKTMYCTTYPLYMFARNVAKDSPLAVKLLIPPDTGCPHDYSLTPLEMLMLSYKNTALIKNGAGLDDIICESVKKANKDIAIFDTSKGIDALKSGEEHAEHDEAGDHDEDEAEHDGHDESVCTDESHHHHDSGLNPHFFASPFTARQVVRNIASAFCEFDPENAELYRRNEAEYLAVLDALCAEYLAAKDPLAGAKFAVQHDIFDYTAHELGLEPAVCLDVEGEFASASTAGELAVLERLKSEKVKVVFTEKQYSSRRPERLAKEAGVEFDTLDSFASGEIAAPLDSYEKAMRKNLETLKKHLAK